MQIEISTGASLRSIAKRLGRSASTLSGEVARRDESVYVAKRASITRCTCILRPLFPDLETKRTTYGSCGESPSRAEAVTLTYRFVFEQRDGRGMVRVGGDR